MTRPWLLPWCCCLALLVSACCVPRQAEETTGDSQAESAVPSGADCKVLAEIPGPEDFVVQKDEKDKVWRLLVSSQDRRNGAEGAIFRVSMRKSSFGLTGEMELRGRGDCSFRPHGVYLREDVEIDGQTEDLLYVINHHDDPQDLSADRSCVPVGVGSTGRPTSIEVFTVGLGSLTMTERLSSAAHLDSGNDLVVDDEGTVYVTAPPTAFQLVQESVLGRRHSEVVRYDPLGSRKWERFAVLSGYTNGIEIVDGKGDEGYEVVVSTSMEGRVHRFGQNGKEKPVLISPFPDPIPEAHDNFTWNGKDKEGRRLLLAAHPERRRFVQHSVNGAARSPSQVWSLTPGLSEGTLVFEDDGTLLSGVSTAACVGDRLILGQVFGPTMLSCPAPVCNPLETNGNSSGESPKTTDDEEQGS